MYKIYIGETVVVCETPQEVTALTAHLQQERPLQTTGHTHSGIINRAMQAGMTNADRQEIDRLINGIKNLDNTVVTSEDLARILGVESVHGVGPRMGAISKRFERAYSMPLEKVLMREGKPGQPTIWKVNSVALENIDIFR